MNAGFWVIEALVFIALIYRIQCGVETTDEAFYAALGFRVVKGNVPIREMWEMQQTSYILLYPFFKIYTMLNGTEGIQLAMRIFNIFCSAAVSVPLFLFLKNIISTRLSLFVCTCYVLYAPFCVYSLGYNNMVFHFGVLTIGFLLLGWLKGGKSYFFLAGVSIALMAFSYPTQVITCAIMVLFFPLLLYLAKTTEIFWKTLAFTVGGVLTALVFSVMLVALCGIDGFWIGLNGMMSDAAYGGTKTASYIFRLFGEMVQYYLMPLAWIPLLVFVLAELWLLVTPKRRLYGLMLVAFLPILCCFYDWNSVKSGTNIMGNLMQIFSYIFPLLLVCKAVRKNQYLRAVIWLQYLPCFLIYIVITLSSAGSYKQANHCFIIAALAAVEAYVIVLEIKQKRSTWVKNLIQGAFVIGCVSVMLLSFYKVVYRDAPVKDLTSRVSSGPFAGLCTTQDRNEYYTNTFNELQQMQEEGKTVCVLWRANFAYLMLDKMIPCTPSMWGIYDSINNEQSFLLYFAQIGKPDYIFTVEPAEGYEMNPVDSSSERGREFSPLLAEYMDSHYYLTDFVYRDSCAVIRKYCAN